MNIIYFFVTIFATTIGSVIGMGGGVIIKPVFDAFAFTDVETIGILSSFSVFTMSLVSVFRNRKSQTKLPYKTVTVLAVASVLGGIVGDKIFVALSASFNLNIVKILQNVILGCLIIVIFIYMMRKNQVKSPELTGAVAYAITGLALGISSSFLGIGGGPINVAVFAYFFSYDTKKAAMASLVTIFFSQAAKLTSVYLMRGFSGYDLSALPFMVTAAILGGMIGAEINKRLKEESVVFLFNGAQILILILCCFNIWHTWQVIS